MEFSLEATPSGGYYTGTATIHNNQGPLKPADLLALTCSKCKLILREPKQVIVCGHRYCKQCIEQLTCGSDGPYYCCVDEERFITHEVRNDKGCLKEILALEVDCPTHLNPCNWRGKLSEMEAHRETCPNKKFLCALGCGEYYQKEDLEAHMTSECPKRPSPCTFCKKNVPLDSMEDHYCECEAHPVTCDYCCKELPNRQCLAIHLEQECDKHHMTCPLNVYPSKGETIQTQLQQMNKKIQDSKIQSATSTVRLRRDMLAHQTELSHLKEKVDKNQTQLVKMNGMIETISETIQTLQNSLTQYAVAIDEVRLRQDVLDVKTTNGTLVWKIPDIHKRYRDAIEHRTISLYSPPFYTSPHGYRMCSRTYLNGDGIGKGTHVSVFFVLMRSEHDNLLSWPFKQSVRFTLINQKNPAASITEAFVPDLHSPSFKKPENDMNIASGFPKFACHSVLQDENFTLGNVIYIKCQVDLSGLFMY